MKIYKYRDCSRSDTAAFDRLETIIRHRAVWCARPDTLNDRDEFSWQCDFKVSAYTAGLLAQLLIRLNGRTRAQAHRRAVSAINAGKLRVLAEPVVAQVIQQCRNEIGLSCFGTSPDNRTLWERYAGNGAGVCVELDVPDDLLGERLRRVNYSDDRRIHIDTFLRARFDQRHAADVYAVSLLSKSTFWAPEEEIRFVSKQQNLNVVMAGAVATRVVVGDLLAPTAVERIREMAGATPVVSRSLHLVTANPALKPTVTNDNV